VQRKVVFRVQWILVQSQVGYPAKGRLLYIAQRFAVACRWEVAANAKFPPHADGSNAERWCHTFPGRHLRSPRSTQVVAKPVCWTRRFAAREAWCDDRFRPGLRAWSAANTMEARRTQWKRGEHNGSAANTIERASFVPLGRVRGRNSRRENTRQDQGLPDRPGSASRTHGLRSREKGKRTHAEVSNDEMRWGAKLLLFIQQQKTKLAQYIYPLHSSVVTKSHCDTVEEAACEIAIAHAQRNFGHAQAAVVHVVANTAEQDQCNFLLSPGHFSIDKTRIVQREHSLPKHCYGKSEVNSPFSMFSFRTKHCLRPIRPTRDTPTMRTREASQAQLAIATRNAWRSFQWSGNFLQWSSTFASRAFHAFEECTASTLRSETAQHRLPISASSGVLYVQGS